MVKQLNYELFGKLSSDFDRALKDLTKTQSKYRELNESIALARSFDIDGFRNNLFNRLLNSLIEEWKKYQENVQCTQFDMIYFEYHEQSTEFMETVSYGIYDMKDFKLTIAPHYYGNEYSFENWEAGMGLNLESFTLNSPIERSDNFYEIVEDVESGYEKLWTFIDALNKYVLNDVFADADRKGVFGGLKIKQGGIFMLDIHDGGNVQSPFYFKS